MTKEIKTKWAEQSLVYSGIIMDMKKDLKKMIDKGLNPELINEKEDQINSLVDFYTSANELIDTSCNLINHLDLHRRITYRVIRLAAKVDEPDKAVRICKTFITN